jgi:hypothetical protein
MKRLFLLLLLIISFSSAFAQFPLGGDMPKIKAYFAETVPYATVQEFKTESGADAICFTKVKVVGDYTFYFDLNGLCTYYIVTYDRKELPDLTHRFDNKFCKLRTANWVSEDSTFDVTLIPPKTGENYFSIVYKPLPPVNIGSNTFASN